MLIARMEMGTSRVSGDFDIITLTTDHLLEGNGRVVSIMMMLFLAECIRIFKTWQDIPFKRKFYSDFTSMDNVSLAILTTLVVRVQ